MAKVKKEWLRIKRPGDIENKQGGRVGTSALSKLQMSGFGQGTLVLADVAETGKGLTAVKIHQIKSGKKKN